MPYALFNSDQYICKIKSFLEMPAKQYPLLLLTSTFLIALTSQPSAAFTIVSTPRISDYYAISDFTDGTGITTLDVVDPNAVSLTPFDLYLSQPFIHEIKRGGTDGLLNDLYLYENQGWTFNKGSDLRGSFNVRRLYACGVGTDCGTTRLGGTANIGIGATLELDYRPSTRGKNRDPKPNQDHLYWIQRIITNYAPGQPGVYQSYIDNKKQGVNAPYPYYARGYEVGSDGYFGDRPYRLTDLNRNYYWTAELYLAEADESNPQNVTIYNGVSWGWLYRYIPKPLYCPASTSSECSPPPPPPTCNGGSGGGGCNNSSITDYTDYNDYQESSIFDINDPSQDEPQYQYLSFLNFNDISSIEEDEYNDSESPVSTPESTSALGLLALGAWGIIKAMKIRFEK